MTTPHQQLGDFFSQHADGGMRDAYHLYEPWDVEERGAEVYEKAISYGIDLQAKDNVKLYGADPHPFQTGFLQDESWCAVSFAGSRVGKSINVMIDMLCMLTGDFPYALRYENGVDTGVKREISKENIIRWGRRDADGLIIDYDFDAEKDDTWDCGNILGVGRYPSTKVLPTGSKIWLGTLQKPFEENWKPLFQHFVPKYLKDTSKGTSGWSEKDRQLHLLGNAEIHVITYHTGGTGFEGTKVPYIFLDEEPPPQIWSNIVTHTDHIRMSMTPYNGITFTYHDILMHSPDNEDINVYHATMYDSPYVTNEWMNRWIRTIPPWQIEARIFGVHSELRGKPYFYEDMATLRKWSTNLVDKGQFYRFTPAKEWTNVRELADIPILAEKVTENLEKDEWVVFEQVDPNTAYWMSVDQAEGSDDEEIEAADRQAAMIFRAPRAGENQDMPVVVAACRSTRTILPFARNCVYACAYYNNAMLAPEVRGEYGASFMVETRDWPFYFTMSVMNDKARKMVTKLGFVTSPKTRPIIFDNIQEWINVHNDEEDGNIRYRPILTEMMQLIVGKKGRPDHPKGGTTDTLITLGIGIYVWKLEKNQIRNNRNQAYTQSAELKKWYTDRSMNPTPTKKIRALGSRR